jgi:hypothetical protein
LGLLEQREMIDDPNLREEIQAAVDASKVVS